MIPQESSPWHKHTDRQTDIIIVNSMQCKFRVCKMVNSAKGWVKYCQVVLTLGLPNIGYTVLDLET